jgi:hypothetical protein
MAHSKRMWNDGVPISGGRASLAYNWNTTVLLGGFHALFYRTVPYLSLENKEKLFH